MEHEDKLGRTVETGELIRNISSYDEHLQKQERVLGQSLVGVHFLLAVMSFWVAFASISILSICSSSHLWG